jgi:hypothetical protein
LLVPTPKWQVSQGSSPGAGEVPREFLSSAAGGTRFGGCGATRRLASEMPRCRAGRLRSGLRPRLFGEVRFPTLCGNGSVGRVNPPCGGSGRRLLQWLGSLLRSFRGRLGPDRPTGSTPASTGLSGSELGGAAPGGGSAGLLRSLRRSVGSVDTPSRRPSGQRGSIGQACSVSRDRAALPTEHRSRLRWSLLLRARVRDRRKCRAYLDLSRPDRVAVSGRWTFGFARQGCR